MIKFRLVEGLRRPTKNLLVTGMSGAVLDVDIEVFELWGVSNFGFE